MRAIRSILLLSFVFLLNLSSGEPPAISEIERMDTNEDLFQETYPVVFLFVRNSDESGELDWKRVLDVAVDCVKRSLRGFSFRYATIQDFGDKWFISFHRAGNGRLHHEITGEPVPVWLGNPSVAIYLDKHSLTVVDPPAEAYRWMPVMDLNPVPLDERNRVPLITPEGYSYLGEMRTRTEESEDGDEG